MQYAILLFSLEAITVKMKEKNPLTNKEKLPT